MSQSVIPLTNKQKSIGSIQQTIRELGLREMKSLGINLDYPYEGSQPRFVDKMKQAGAWLNEAYGRLAAVDENFNITGPDANESFVRRLIHTPSEVGFGKEYNGRYRIWCETGELNATFNSGGKNLVEVNSQTIEVDLDWDILIEINVIPGASIPKNIHCVKVEDLDAYHSGQHIDPVFLAEATKYFETGRFMNWMGTNSLGDTYAAPVVEFSDYVSVEYQRWGDRVPLEVICDLCNRARMNAWICIPHKATDACVRSMATFFRDNLNPERTLRIEYSNEIWNSLFDQTAWIWDQAVADWGFAPAEPRWTHPAWISWGAKRAYECSEIFRDVFLERNDQLVFVSWGNFPAQSLEAPDWATYEPETYVNPVHTFREMACNPYFGAGSLLIENSASIARACRKSAKAGAEEIAGHAAKYNTKSLERWKNEFSTLSEINEANETNITPCIYEYNQHLDAIQAGDSELFDGGIPVPNFVEALEIACEGELVLAELDRVREFFKANGVTSMCYYKDYESWSIFGQWGAQTYIGQDRSPWISLRSWHEMNPKWW